MNGKTESKNRTFTRDEHGVGRAIFGAAEWRNAIRNGTALPKLKGVRVTKHRRFRCAGCGVKFNGKGALRAHGKKCGQAPKMTGMRGKGGA